MGIRIHKVLGWGLTDIQSENHRLTDPRFSQEFLDPKTDEYVPGRCSDSVQPFLASLQTAEGMDQAIEWACGASGAVSEWDRDMPGVFLRMLSKRADQRIETCPASYAAEYGDPKVMVFTPLDYPDWSRSDDTIDYYDYDHSQEYVPTCKTLPCGIYPFLGMVKVPGSPESTEDHRGMILQSKLEPSVYQRLVGKWDPKDRPLAPDPVVKYLLTYYRPQIPDTLVAFLRFAKVFSDPKFIQELRPVLYTYWS